MLDFSSAVQWWDEWQLRILVLGSLFIQYFLCFSTTVRRFALPYWFRAFMWLAYQGGDALPIYALATLFNRHKLQPAANGSGLEVLWAPVLLIHLGGQHMMTAYSIEDNELWTRHAITAMSQIAVALYVFCRSWSGEKRLLQAAILFVVGIIKTSHKPLALKAASFNTMVTSSSLSKRRQQGNVVQSCLAVGFNDIIGYGLVRSGREEEGAEEKDVPLEEFVKQARRCVLASELPSDQPSSHHEAIDDQPSSQHEAIDDQPSSQHEAIDDQPSSQQGASLETLQRYVYRLLVDISAPYSARIKTLQFFMASPKPVHRIIHLLNFSSLHLYTKTMRMGGPIGCYLHYLLPFLTLASVFLFSTSHRYYNHNAEDVKVTSILFCCTALLDFLLLLLVPCLRLLLGPCLGFRDIEQFWQFSQYSLMSFCARNKRPTILMKLAALVCCKDYVNMQCYIDHTPLMSSSTRPIMDLVLGYVKDGWKVYIHDATSYRGFNSHRGQWTLKRYDSEQRLGWSLKMAFDRSVLLWHIATDLCFHHQSITPQGQECVTRSRLISNYMAYLLFIRPEMLMPGTRSGIFTVACDDVELMLVGKLALDEKGLAQGILHRAPEAPSEIGALVPNARRLAKQLMELHDEGERWKLVQGVWVEMLCYSAGRCRGYLHAKNMSEGRELLSSVWLLLSLMGMETFADRFQKPESPETKEGVEDGYDGEGRATETEVDAIV